MNPRTLPVAALLLLLPSLAGAQSAPCVAQEAHKLGPSTATQAVEFGESVAVDGDVALVGAPSWNPSTGQHGQAYVFRFDGAQWIEEQELVAGPILPFQDFGRSVALDGDVAVVGAPGNNCQEAVYVYRFDGTSWLEDQQLTPSSATHCNRFGGSVAVQGDLLLVGAERDDALGSDSGSVFAFRYDGVDWVEQQKLVPGTLGVDDNFGHALALDAGVLLVGAPDFQAAGSAYVFRHAGLQWNQEAHLTASDGQPSDLYGWSVSLRGARAAIGAPYDNNATGSVYVYAAGAGVWSGEERLQASDPLAGAQFGWAVDLGDEFIGVGAPQDDEQGPFSGSAYVLRHQQGTWVELGKHTASTGENGDALGTSLAVGPGRLLSGLPGDGDTEGAVCVFDLLAFAFALDANYVTTGHHKLVVSACGGTAAAPLLVIVTSIGGAPALLPLATGAFDAGGHWSYKVLAPASVAGLALGFQAFTLDGLGGIAASNPETVSF